MHVSIFTIWQFLYIISVCIMVVDMVCYLFPVCRINGGGYWVVDWFQLCVINSGGYGVLLVSSLCYKWWWICLILCDYSMTSNSILVCVLSLVHIRVLYSVPIRSLYSVQSASRNEWQNEKWVTKYRVQYRV